MIAPTGGLQRTGQGRPGAGPWPADCRRYIRHKTQGTILCVVFVSVFFCPREGRGPPGVVVSAGKLADFTGKQRITGNTESRSLCSNRASELIL